VTDEPSLPQKLVDLHHALLATELPHAFGGALALAWCTADARGTRDIDVNVLVGPDQVPTVVAALPDEVEVSDRDLHVLRQDGQARLWWGRTPVDVFLNTTEFHDELADRVRHEPFHGAVLPFLDCSDLAVFKAFFSRSRDWVDLEEMVRAGALDVERVLGTLVRHLGGDDPRIERLRRLTAGS
jgi:hypothetical protein